MLVEVLDGLGLRPLLAVLFGRDTAESVERPSLESPPVAVDLATPEGGLERLELSLDPAILDLLEAQCADFVQRGRVDIDSEVTWPARRRPCFPTAALT